ncbi:tetratricopeptide repeat protein [Mariniflexile fucanivorans]|uniref:tetratricopeptide repeat protein n=1 Tax=Mariniflexile fucanivorans TaxID=264023 RepID=UPI00104FBE2F|nr:hypothetical protein [Mariniflexile fucanivorans]
MKDLHNIPEALLDTIDRYLQERMPADEKLQFEERIEKDPILKAQIEDVKLLRIGIGKAVLKSRLKSFHEDLPDAPIISKEKVFKINYKYHAIAASIVIALGCFWFLNRDSKNERLFAKHFKPDFGLATTMSESNNYDFDDAMVDYKQKNYDLAIKKWETILNAKPKNDTLNYFLGISYLAKNAEKEAVSKFQNVVKQDQSAFKSDAYLYLGLAYLKLDNLEKARENLALSDTENSRLLLSELKN